MTSQRSDFASIHLTTEDLPARDRVAVWREVIGRTVLRLDIEPLPDQLFYADVKQRSLSALSVGSCSFSGTHQRTRALLSDGNDALILVVNRAGPLIVSTRGHELRPRDGDAFLMSCAETSAAARPSLGRMNAVVIPYATLAPLVPHVDDAIGRLVPRDGEVLKLLTSYIGAAEEIDPSAATPEMLSSVVTHLCDLIALTIGATRDGAALAQSRGLSAARLTAIKADIAENLGRTDLAVAAVAQRHRLTPRHLHRLFEAEGLTYSEFVLGLRLARAHRMLTDPRFAGWTVKAIATELGFGDRSYFNRAFRRRYGVSPSDLRGRN